MNRASSPTGWVRNPVMRSPELDPTQASSYELGWTTNPITGCLNGCPYCYARKLANGRLRSRYLSAHSEHKAILPVDIEGNYEKYMSAKDDPFYPRFWEDRLYELKRPISTLGHAKLQEPKGIFPCDMSDLFGIGIPKEWTEQVFYAIKERPEHRFYLLTKQPQNLPQWSPFPDNCWVGVTATNPERIKDACYYLREIEATVKFTSFEPLLSDVSHIFFPEYIDWVIIGAQTKPYKPPKIEWVEEIVRAADRAGIPVFLKDNLEPLWTFENSREPFFKFSRSSLGATNIGKLRQELPNLEVDR